MGCWYENELENDRENRPGRLLTYSVSDEAGVSMEHGRAV
jgi:hypothetical protein